MKARAPSVRRALRRWALLLCLGVSPGVVNAGSSAPPPTPWRLAEALGAPAWLRFGLEHRSRLEHLTDDFRAPERTLASGWMLRTLATLDLTPGFLVASVELQDSRAVVTDSVQLNTTIVNPVELLRASVGVRRSDVFQLGDVASVTLGRQTLDVGSRRLLARNDFRNTINAFDGVHVEWSGPRGEDVRAFAVVPVRKLPSDPAALRAGAVAFDLENPSALVWGLFAASAPLAAGVRLEGLFLGLHEADAPDLPSANRQLVTSSVRVLRQPSGPGVDVQAEAMVQLGSSRASTSAADTRTLQHVAFSLHASGGYRLAAPWAPRLLAVYDYASGDQDPSDGVNERFDPLFGARRFEWGPTGLYGALSRSNLSSPGLRLELTPGSAVDGFLAVRLAWLASARDAWVSGGLRDPSGASGSYLGEQVEWRLRWHLFPRNLVLDLGAAWLLRGEFARQAQGGRPQSSFFVYSQLTGTL